MNEVVVVLLIVCAIFYIIGGLMFGFILLPMARAFESKPMSLRKKFFHASIWFVELPVEIILLTWDKIRPKHKP